MLFREPTPSSVVETDLGNSGLGSGGDGSDGEPSEMGWNEKILDNESDNDIVELSSS